MLRDMVALAQRELDLQEEVGVPMDDADEVGTDAVVKAERRGYGGTYASVGFFGDNPRETGLHRVA